jgi:hypothetical protein
MVQQGGLELSIMGKDELIWRLQCNFGPLGENRRMRICFFLGRFWAFINYYGVVDLDFKGNLFNWSNERRGSVNIK